MTCSQDKWEVDLVGSRLTWVEWVVEAAAVVALLSTTQHIFACQCGTFSLVRWEVAPVGNHLTWVVWVVVAVVVDQ